MGAERGVKSEGVLDNPLMNAILHQNHAVKSEKKTVPKVPRSPISGKSVLVKSGAATQLDALCPVPRGKDVLSGNTKIGGLFARYRHNKEKRPFNLNVGCSRFNALMEIWGIEYLRKSPEDLRRHKAIYKELPIGNVRWIEETKTKTEDKEESGDSKLRRVLKKQLTVILAEDNGQSQFDAEQRQKILQSAHKKVLKAYQQLNDNKKNGGAGQQTLSQFIDNMTQKIDDLVKKYVIQYKKRMK